MKKRDNLVEFRKMLEEVDNKKKRFFYHHFTKYIVNYTVEDDHIKVISNTGKYRTVKNTSQNLSKINQVIVKNKIEIAKKIDEYEEHSTERLIILLINIMLVGGSGALIPLSFFTGSFLFFLLSILVFSISVVTTSMSGFNYYLLVKEIQSLKKITGYKKEMEFNLPHIDVKSIKSR